MRHTLINALKGRVNQTHYSVMTLTMNSCLSMVRRLTQENSVKIYDHPLNSKVTVIEIEKPDETEDFLNEIIDGFDKYGNAYPSSSAGEGDKQVIYLDGRRRKIFNLDDTDLLCDITVRLAGMGDDQNDVFERSISLAEAAGDERLIERLMEMPAEYFSAFKSIKKAG